MNYVPIVTFWIFTYHKIWILSLSSCDAPLNIDIIALQGMVLFVSGDTCASVLLIVY